MTRLRRCAEGALIAAGLAIISVTLRPEPNRRTSARNGRSLTPVIGASTTGRSAARNGSGPRMPRTSRTWAAVEKYG